MAGRVERPPRATYLVHGEPSAAEAFRETLKQRLAWEVHVAQHEQRVGID